MRSTDTAEPPVAWDIETVEAFDVISKDVTPEQVKQSVRVSSDLGQHVGWLAEYVDQGWDELYLHFVGKEQSGFLRRVLGDRGR
jgi:hypothetical protein